MIYCKDLKYLSEQITVDYEKFSFSKTSALRKNVRSQNVRSKNVLLHVLRLAFQVYLLKTLDVCELFSIAFFVLKKIVKSLFKREEKNPVYS